MSEDLKPCPFCGGEGTVERIGHKYRPACFNEDCIAWLMDNLSFATKREATTAWNTRTTAQAERDELVEFIRQLDCECDSYHGFTCGRCSLLTKKGDEA